MTSHIRDTARVELFDRMEAGDIWGVRLRDSMALARNSVFGGSSAKVSVIWLESTDIEFPGTTRAERLCPYKHRRWQPEDFGCQGAEDVDR